MDLRGQNLREMALENREFAKSRIIGCTGEGASFRGSRFSQVQILAERAEKVSFRGADFSNARLSDCVIGPATLDLAETIWKDATLREVRFDYARLANADFSEASLTNVYFRAGQLNGVSFRGAALRKVSFEKASLVDADFTGATFFKMDFWGEPDWTGAIISDELRYSYGEIDKPAERVAKLIASPTTPVPMREALERLEQAHSSLLSYPECSLIGRELTDIIDPELFPSLLKSLKEVQT